MTGRRLALFFLASTAFTVAGSFSHLSTATPVALAKTSSAAPAHSASRLSIPMYFETNQGQTDGRVKFLSRGHGYGLFLTSDEAVLSLHAATKSQSARESVVHMRLAGANSTPHVSGAELMAGKSNYFIGNNPAKWHRNIPQYGRVNYDSIYPGIDLTYYGRQGQLEYDFRLAPGADPNQIAMTFAGTSTRIDARSGDLVLSTGNGDVRFKAPYVYQRKGNEKKTIAGSFRQLAGNKIGFQIGAYDRNRELVIDPSLSYFTYIGGSGTETNTQVAVDQNQNIYLAGTTDSANFPHTVGATFAGVRDVFIAKLNTSIPQPQSQLVYATYVGGTGADDLASLAVDSNGQVYVAGTTTSTDFPTTPNAFQTAPKGPGTHGFMTKLDVTGATRLYSTYVSGINESGTTFDLVTGLAIDTRGDAFLTGTTTSTNFPDGNPTGFPATPNGYQLAPLADTQFFASKIDTSRSGSQSMVYSTYFGGATPASPTITGGGIAVDNGGNMYITGATDFLFIPGADDPNQRTLNFPILNAQQSCLDQAPNVTQCSPDQTALDAFVAKINPNRAGNVGLIYSTYLGGSLEDAGLSIAVDAAGNAYVTGQTLSSDWTAPTAIAPFQSAFGGGNVGNHDAFVAKIGNPTNTSPISPLTYFTYLGGTGDDIGLSIAVDSLQGAHVTGSTSSPDLPVLNRLGEQEGFGGQTDAFAAQLVTTLAGRAAGDYLFYLGGGGPDRGTGVFVDVNNATYVAGETQSSVFPHPSSPPFPPPFQGTLNGGSQDAFVARISATSTFIEPDDTPPTASPNPASLGNQVTFTFTFVNNGQDPAARVIFSGTFPSTGVTFNSATSSPGGACPAPVNSTVLCNIGAVAVGAKVTVTVVITPTTGTTSVNVTPSLSSNGGTFVAMPGLGAAVPVTDFTISAAPSSVTINAGESTSFVVTLSPVPTYSSAITVSDSGLPTGATGTFTSTSVTLTNSPATTTLNISTTPRPVNTGSLFRGGSLFAAWLPIGGLSLLGLGVGAGVKRRRWLAGMLLGLTAGVILFQAACGGSSSNTTPTTGTPAGTYTITITGASGSASHNQKVTLIVN